MKEETRLWFEKAEQDFKTVEILLQSNEGPPGIICFHCQQAVEKFLKAFLVERDVEFLKTHDLLQLIEGYMIPIYDSFREIIPAATNLTEYSTSTRYPDSGEEMDIVAAREAYKAMIEIKSIVLAKLNKD